MKKLYCPNCGLHLLGAGGELHDCLCGWMQPKDEAINQEIADELEYLRFFYESADFGPAHEDVVMIIDDDFRRETGKELPEEYRRR